MHSRPLSVPSDPRSIPTYVPPITGGTVVKVYDGDTITIATHVPGSRDRTVYKFSVRLAGIDCPELRSKSEDERARARASQQALSDAILGKRVTLTNTRTEKYGRLLCDVWDGGRHMNQWLLDQGLAVAYDGRKKKALS